MTDEKIIENANDRLKLLFDLYPIDDLRPSEVTDEMRVGLARFYSDKGQRAYIENAVKVAIQKMSLSSTPVEIAYYKSRIDVLQQLLAKGKQCFTNLEILKKGVKKNAL